MTVPADIFSKIPTSINVEKAKDVNMTLVFSLTGANPGDWTVKVADGTASVNEGAADSPNATINMDSDDFTAMMSGKLNPMMAFMSGKVKVDGDLNSVMKMQSIFNM